MGTPRTPKGRTKVIAARLAAEYPEALCELNHRNAFELLAATVLSAQTTDVRVNMVTPALFARYPDAAALAGADPGELEEIVRSTGFYQSKARNLIAMATRVLDEFGGDVPTALDDLVTAASAARPPRGAQRRIRAARASRRHSRRPAQPSLGPHRRRGSGEGGGAAVRVVAAGRVGQLQPAHDPARSQSVRREEAEVRGVRAGRPVSGVAGASPPPSPQQFDRESGCTG
jgi:endonuclease-3